MAIKAKIPTGQNSVRTSALYQWDYGQTLEIESENLPSLIEVHFACRDMTEAVVHTCSVVNGVATVAIPDRCLEQASEITAWVYEIEGTAGRTIYSISIPITARTRPARSESIPQSVQDTYTQLITEVNELLDQLTDGDITVAFAGRATYAEHAYNADSATTATTANTAGSATNAVNDGDGNKISDTYVKVPGDYEVCGSSTRFDAGLYVFRVLILHTDYRVGEQHIVVADTHCLAVTTELYSSTFVHNDALYRLKFKSVNQNYSTGVSIEPCDTTNGASIVADNIMIYYKKLTD